VAGTLSRYKAVVEKVHSGDDLILMVDLGVDSLYKRVRARLQGVDTPDAYKANAETEAGRIRERVRRLVSHKHCIVDVHTTGKGGWVVTLYVALDNEELMNVNDVLRAMGFVYNRSSAA
jgi:hypothetical protein